MRLKTLTATDPGGNPLLDYGYTYDATGNIVTKATEHGEYGYDYDASSRLTSADNPVLDDESYTYDNMGNRLTSADVSGNWNYNANNELLGFADVEYTYDENGNMTQIKAAGQVVWTYVYDAANRLVHVEDGTGSISADYYYDPFGRRLWKDVGGTRTYFFYSDEGLIGEYDETGAEIKTYGYKPDSTWTTDPLFLKQGTEYYFYQNDHLGTPQKLVAMNGAVVWSAQYSAFGKTDVQVETVVNNLRFPGQFFDAETGLHYNWFRYYDPKIGRYLRVDPIGFVGGDVNWYGWNDPVNSLDPFGLVRFDEVITGSKRIIVSGGGWLLKQAVTATVAQLVVAGKVIVGIGAAALVVLYPRTGDITVGEEQALIQEAIARHQTQYRPGPSPAPVPMPQPSPVPVPNPTPTPRSCSRDDFSEECQSGEMRKIIVYVSPTKGDYFQNALTFETGHAAVKYEDALLRWRLIGWWPKNLVGGYGSVDGITDPARDQEYFYGTSQSLQSLV